MMSWWHRRGLVRYSVVGGLLQNWRLILGSIGGFLGFAWLWWWIINKAIGR